jgi:hypothetical protein
MTIEELIQQEKESQAVFEMNNTHRGYKISDLHALFNTIRDPADWRAPIRATMRGEAVMAATAAIEFYTATTAKVSVDTETMTYTVVSEGYRNGPAGDH